MAENSFKIGSLALAVLANALLIGYAFAAYQDTEAWQAATRFTARISLFIFALLFVRRTLRKNKTDQELYLLSALAVSHLIHLYFLLKFNHLKGGLEWNIRLLGGITAYAFMIAIPLLGFTHRLTPPSFERFKTIGMYVIWFVMAGTYVPRILGNKNHAGGTPAEFYLGFGLMIGLMLFHLYVRISARNKTGFF
ncbi:MAG: hypothetical protein U0X91_22160 [Spirosomataceae bacterium]